jgi:hypothetical protein
MDTWLLARASMHASQKKNLANTDGMKLQSSTPTKLILSIVQVDALWQSSTSTCTYSTMD